MVTFSDRRCQQHLVGHYRTHFRAAGQKITLGRIHTGQVVTAHVAAETITIDLGGDDTRTVRRTTTQPVRSIKAHQLHKAAHVS
jgi:hypothetical protein